MDSEILQEFIKHAEIYLPTIRGGILVCAQEGNAYGELHTALRQVQIIKNSAAAFDLDEIKQAAEKLELELEPMVFAREQLSDEQSRKLLDKLAILEAHLTKLSFKTDFFPDDVTDFIEESFGNLQINKPVEEAVTEKTETADEWEEEFEIDEEMLEVFALEAEDLLQNINSHLAHLANNPNNRESLLEVRRSAHTLKGSAGIVGLKQLSDLAHRVEDLLDYMAENEIESNEKIFELLLASTDCFETLANGESSVQLEKKIERLYTNFDEVFAFLKQPKINVVAAEIKAAANPADEKDAQVVATQNRSVVRVSLEKLDELVKIASDLLVSRSVFEQRLSEFDRQIKELNNSTNRLQQATGKLEIDFEANMLQGSGQLSVVSSQLQQSPQSAIRNPQSFDALEFDRYTEFHQTTRELVETAADTSSINSELDILKGNLELLFDSQKRSIEEMQDKLLRLRMVKFGALTARLQRTIRVTCEEESKFADLIIEGENLEFDTQILDSLVEPLLHLLRNAVAHGIESPETRRLLGKEETGKIFLRIHSEGTHVSLTVSDDGRGVSAATLVEKAVQNNFISRAEADKLTENEAFALMFLPGLTTADKLSQVSGRGVGMNIVKTSILRHQGSISVNSKPHKGTIFTVRLPMALAVTRALLVKAGGQIFAFPLKLAKKATEISAENLERAMREKSLQIEGGSYSVFHLNGLLGLVSDKKTVSENAPLLLLETLESSCSLAIDEIVKTEEIVIKPLGAPLHNRAEFLGAAILGDGSVVPVLDLIHLIALNAERGTRNAELKSEDGRRKLEAQNSNSALRTPHSALESMRVSHSALNVLIVDDSPSVRHINSKLIKGAGWQPVVAKDGLEALEILQASQELPDIILTDVEMPRMNGYELLSSLKQNEKLRAIPVIMITSRAGEKHRRKAFDLGVSEYLAKPYQDAALLGKIKDLTA
jgi:chemosensory pili system protein ChpA (sensor histidine kinase/response regulator)